MSQDFTALPSLLVGWAERARALVPLWREAAGAATGAEADLARATADEWERGWPLEVRRAATDGNLSASTGESLDPRSAPVAGIEPRWMGLALLSARYFDAFAQLRAVRAAPVDEGGAGWETLARRVADIEGPRASAWAQILGRRARSGAVESIARASRTLDSFPSWNL